MIRALDTTRHTTRHTTRTRHAIRPAAATLAAAAVSAAALAASPTASAAIPEPYTSPGVTRIWVGGDAAPGQCLSGYLCAYVSGNANHGGWWEFKFYNCGIYNVYYWHDYSILGDSFVIDDQSGGVTTTYYRGFNGSGPLQSMKPAANQFQDVQQQGSGSTLGWNPISSIRVC